MHGKELNRPVIVVVDDEAMVRNIVARTLEREGYVVLSAADGPEALEVIRSYPDPISLVITDFHMPQMNGLELCERVKQERPETRLLVISGRTSQMKSAPRGVAFLKKPFAPRILAQNVFLLVGTSAETAAEE